MIIQVQNLNFEYPDKLALEDINFSVEEGSISALVGPNGAGKTTLMRCLAALSRPRTGSVIINGYSALDEPRMVHRQVGYLSDFFGLYDQLTVRQSLYFTAHSRLPELDNMDGKVATAIQRSGVATFADMKISMLSRGMRQRVGIAQAIIPEPRVLLLDEPASGLDPEARHSLSNLLLELRDAGMVIIVSSHILAELEDYSTEMLVIQDGKLIEHKKITSRDKQSNTSMTVKFGAEAAVPSVLMESWPGITELKSEHNILTLYLDEAELSKAAFLKRMVMADMPVEEVFETHFDLQKEYIKTVEAHKKAVNQKL